MNKEFSMTDLVPKTPKMIKGSAGPYWQVAANESGSAEIYVKFKFESGQLVDVDGKPTPADCLQANVLYLGEQFEIPAPFQYIEARPYPINGVLVSGHVLGKIWVPLGEFNKQLSDMHEYVRDNVIDAFEDYLKPLYTALSAEPIMPLKDLWNMLMEGLDKDKVKLAPKFYSMSEWAEEVKKMKTQAGKPKPHPFDKKFGGKSGEHKNIDPHDDPDADPDLDEDEGNV